MFQLNMLHSLSLSKISTHHLSSLSLPIFNLRYIDFWSVIRLRHVGPLHINSHKSQPFSPSAGWASPIPPRCVVCLPVRVRFSVHPACSNGAPIRPPTQRRRRFGGKSHPTVPPKLPLYTGELKLSPYIR